MVIYEYGNKNSNNILIQPIGDQDLGIIDNEVHAINEYTIDYYLFAVKVDDWNNDLSPWEAPAVFGNKGFGSGASDTLGEIMKLITDQSKDYYIGGYSLAGLFSLWTAHQTDVFKGVAAASPSIWFPGFLDYMRKNDLRTERVYLSLGDNEAKTRNAVMSTVADRIQEANELLNRRGIITTLEWNKGNHFKETDLRMAKGFGWILGA
ncbi:MAG: esterase [Lachnospiraceae bacterium]|nr:esterase [Lachnospiraceae bacterium]